MQSTERSKPRFPHRRDRLLSHSSFSGTFCPSQPEPRQLRPARARRRRCTARPRRRPAPWRLVTVLAWIVRSSACGRSPPSSWRKWFPFLADPERFLPILLNLVSSGIVVALVVMHLVNVAHSAKYFAAFPPLTYVVAAISMAYNGYFIVMLIASNSRRDEAYREYLVFRRADEESAQRGLLSALQRQGIQSKLLLTFVPLIIVIIFVLAFFLLRDFSSTILAAVNANGEGLADRTASVVKANPTDQHLPGRLLQRRGRRTNEAPRDRTPPSDSTRSRSTDVTRRRAGSWSGRARTRSIIGARAARRRRAHQNHQPLQPRRRRPTSSWRPSR